MSSSAQTTNISVNVQFFRPTFQLWVPSGHSRETSISIEGAKKYFNELSVDEQEEIQIKKGKNFWKQIGCCSRAWYLCTCRCSYLQLGKLYMQDKNNEATFIEIWKQKHNISTYRPGVLTPASSPVGKVCTLRGENPVEKSKEKKEDVVALGGPVAAEIPTSLTSATVSGYQMASMAALGPCRAYQVVKADSRKS